VLDLSELEVSAKVGEVDRANLREGQDVTIRLDAVPEKSFHGKIKSLSGSASANVWSGDVAKKFDVAFSVDMKELMSGLGARPEQIAQVLATAERNRRRPVLPSITAAAIPGDQGGTQPSTTGASAPPSPTVSAGAVRPAPTGGETRQAGSERAAAAPRVPGFAKPGADAPPGFMSGAGRRFSRQEIENAELPSAPEEGNQLEVLLRPGMLTDVEIIVEKVPNAIHVPLQAVFEKDGHPIVYVKHGSRFDERRIKPLKRSESVLVIAEGVSPGETIALADPNRQNKKDKAGSKKGGVPAPAAGAGGNRS